MNGTTIYQLFIKSFVYILILGQLWVVVAPFCMNISDIKSELVEVFGSEDSETEKKDKEKEKDKEEIIRQQLANAYFGFAIFDSGVLLSIILPSLCYPETISPPPKGLA